MPMKDIRRWSRLGSGCVLFALTLATGSPGRAQPNGPLVPLEQTVLLDQECTDSPTVLAVEGGTLAVWRRLSQPTGIFARTGPTLGELGPAVMLRPEVPADAVRVAPIPGGFVAAWIRFPASQVGEAVFQRFTFDLAPSAAVVVVGPASLLAPPALLADADGGVTLAYYSPANTVRARLYSAGDVPLTPPIEVDPLVASGQGGLPRLAAGDDGFLVAWEGSLPAETPGLWVRAFGLDGAPAAASVRVASLGVADFDIGWAEDEYLAAVPGGNVWGYRLDVNGTPTAPAGLLAPAVSPHHVQLAAGSGVLWLSFVETETGLLASRIELPSLAVLEDPQLLGPQPGTDFLAKGSVSATGAGLLATWQTAWFSPIPLPCAGATAIYAQEFGSPPLVDVPAAAPPGLLALALLTAAGALVVLRRP